MASTSQDVANEALSLIGYDGFPISGPAPNFDGSAPGQIAQRTYPYAVAAVGRLNAWSFPRTSAALVVTGNVAPFPWSYEYGFPANCIDVWQLSPTSLVDPNTPLPITWARGISIVSAVQVSVLWSNLSPARAIFNGNPLESTWDPLFRETVVRYLAAEFAVAGLGKPDLMAAYVEQWRQLVPAAVERTDQ
jgi:hypothetical protein